MTAATTVIVERTFVASPSRVWSAWTDVDLLTKWWGCATDMLWNVHTWDVRVGGEIHVSLDYDGEPYEVRGRFLAVDDERRLQYEWEAGQVITVSIEPQRTGARMTIEHAGLPTDEMREIVTGGWSASVEQILVVLA